MSTFEIVSNSKAAGQYSLCAAHVLLVDLPNINSPEQALDLSIEKWDVMRKAPGAVDDGHYTCGFCKWQTTRPNGCDECLARIASRGCNIAGSFWFVYVGDLMQSRDTRAASEDIYLFLCALRDGGVEAGKKFYERWRKAREQANKDS